MPQGTMDMEQIQIKFEEFRTLLMNGMCVSGKPGNIGSQTQEVLAQLAQCIGQLSRKY